MNLCLRRVAASLVVATGILWLAPLARATDRKPWPAVVADQITPDPRASWGRLDNGLRWVILPNKTPPGQVSLRLMIEAGSLMENEDQRGLAHFLEHMAFKGSTNIPPGSMVETLERLGLAFGPDTNARTGFDSTVYQLDLPHGDPAAIGTGLGMLSEISHRLLLQPDQIEPERGVIASERRLRNTPQSRAFEDSMRFVLPGSRYTERLPIGDEEVVRTAPRERFVEFYRDWYTPERAIVAVVGDVDPAAVAAMIQERFKDFAGPLNPPADPDMGTFKPRGLEVRVASDPGLPPSLTLSLPRPYDDRPESLDTWRDYVLGRLAYGILDRRLAVIAAKPDPAFTRAGLGTARWRGLSEVSILRLMIAPDRAEEALGIAETELRRAVQHGVTPEELAEGLRILRASLVDQARSASTRPSRDLVDEILETALDDRVFTDAATDLALIDRIAAGIDVAAVNGELVQLWGSGPPLVELVGPQAPDDAAARLTAAWNASAAKPVEPPAATEALRFAYEQVGTPGTVTQRREIADLGILSLDFANGVALDMKPTTFEADTVDVVVRFGRGRLGLPQDKHGLDLLTGWAFLDGGLGRQDAATIERIFADRRLDLDLNVSTSSLALIARTSRRDLDAVLALMAAYFVDPGYRPEAMNSFRQRLDATYRRMGSSPRGVIETAVERIIHDDDPRFGLPARAEAEARTLDELRAWMTPQLRGGPMQVAIVGDIDPVEAERLVAGTFGALPDRLSEPQPPPPVLSLPHPAEPVVLYHDGARDQAMALSYWATDDGSDQQREKGLDLLADIFGDRLLREVRGREGATYSPQVASRSSLNLPGYGYLVAALDVAAADAERMAALVQKVAGELRQSGVTEDELVRAIQPQLAQAAAARDNNRYWLYQVIVGMRQYPQLLDMARSLQGDIERSDPAGLAKLAGTYLAPERLLTILILPRPS